MRAQFAAVLLLCGFVAHAAAGYGGFDCGQGVHAVLLAFSAASAVCGSC